MTKEQALKACARVMMLGTVTGCMTPTTYKLNVVFNNGDKDTIYAKWHCEFDPHLSAGGCVKIGLTSFACNVRSFTYTTVKP